MAVRSIQGMTVKLIPSDDDPGCFGCYKEERRKTSNFKYYHSVEINYSPSLRMEFWHSWPRTFWLMLKCHDLVGSESGTIDMICCRCLRVCCSHLTRIHSGHLLAPNTGIDDPSPDANWLEDSHYYRERRHHCSRQIGNYPWKIVESVRK